MSTALYRRYRPDTFEDVIGQGHVTDALQAALGSGRIAHAFLFSGPRGCGKTTSARILARCLNCAEGPTPTPCGVCESCVELAAGGPGSLDVVEIDAASHSSVNDTRELRDKVNLAPVRDRYRVFILDEAHMVSAQGFNALLKVVEEPPEHVKFIFATTDPDKVINTIRSRTHHYPFRLVAPAVLVPFLHEVTEKEGIGVDEGVYPLVVRSGGGSVRDSLSVLDQLIAGSSGHVTTREAVDLLGYTDASLLERTVDALGSNDGAEIFRIVDEVVAAGHEPRRFVEDLLQRLRDLVVCALAGERASAILAEIPGDQLVVMHAQANRWGTRLLSRRADIVEAALREMSGATAPRLQLELLMARLLVSEPAAPGPADPSRSGTAEARAQNPSVNNAEAREASTITAVAGAESSEGDVAGVAEPADEVPPATEVEAASAEVEPPSTPAASSRTEVVTAPDADFLRSNWNDILSALDKRGSVFRNLMRNMAGGAAQGATTYVFFKEPAVAAQFQRFEGEKHLGTILSAMTGVSVAVRAAPLAEREALMSGAPDEDPDASSTTGVGPEVEESADSSDPHDERLQSSESSDKVRPDRRRSELEGASSSIPTAAAGAPVETLAAHGPANDQSEAPSPTDPDGVYRGRPAVDVFLDIVGGAVIEEKILGPSIPAEPEPDEGGHRGDDVPPEFDLEDR